jgi:flavorubredoxin
MAALDNAEGFLSEKFVKMVKTQQSLKLGKNELKFLQFLIFFLSLKKESAST